MTVRPVRLSAAPIAGLLAILLGVSSAGAQGTEEERRACTPDVMRLCRDYIPSVERIVACMEARHAELSPACQAVISPPAPAVVATPAKPSARRTASGASSAKTNSKTSAKTAAKPGAARTVSRPMNLLPASAAKPAPAKKPVRRDKQAQRTP